MITVDEHCPPQRADTRLLRQHDIPIVIPFEEDGAVRSDGHIPADRGEFRKHIMRPQAQIKRRLPVRQPVTGEWPPRMGRFMIINSGVLQVLAHSIA